VASRREDHQQAEEQRARRQLDELGRRWPRNSTVYLVATVVLALVLLAIL